MEERKRVRILSEEEKQKRREYARRYRANPENREKIRAYQRKWAKENPEKVKARMMRYCAKQAKLMQEQGQGETVKDIFEELLDF